MEVPDRATATLKAIITEWVQPGTRIILDGFPSYIFLATIHGGIYKQDAVIHEQHFVHPEDESVHAQNRASSEKSRGKSDTSSARATSKFPATCMSIDGEVITKVMLHLVHFFAALLKFTLYGSVCS